MGREPLRAPRGMNDLLPEEAPRWHLVESVYRRVVEAYGYREVRTPIVEQTSLFARSIGETTDIVEKEMYSFEDKGGDALTLRPEGTAGAVRAFVEHSIGPQHGRTKWYYLGAMFRHERPQKGRYRQFYQAGAELFGDSGPECDAEMIDMVAFALAEMGVRDLEVVVNSLGGAGTRAAYRDTLVAYLSARLDALCPECKRRLSTNPLRILDCKVKGCVEVASGAPPIVDSLDAPDRAHFDDLRRALDGYGTPYVVEPRLVRGLDYYTRTLFEVRGRHAELGSQNALGGGGRYDNLVEDLGGPPTPAIGYALGIDRIALCLGADLAEPIEAFVAAAGPDDLAAARRIAKALRRAGVSTETDLGRAKLGAQLKRADRVQARISVIVGADERVRGGATLRDMRAQAQRFVAEDQIVAEVRAVVRGAP